MRYAKVSGGTARSEGSLNMLLPQCSGFPARTVSRWSGLASRSAYSPKSNQQLESPSRQPMRARRRRGRSSVLVIGSLDLPAPSICRRSACPQAGMADHQRLARPTGCDRAGDQAAESFQAVLRDDRRPFDQELVGGFGIAKAEGLHGRVLRRVVAADDDLAHVLRAADRGDDPRAGSLRIRRRALELDAERRPARRRAPVLPQLRGIARGVGQLEYVRVAVVVEIRAHDTAARSGCRKP